MKSLSLLRVKLLRTSTKRKAKALVRKEITLNEIELDDVQSAANACQNCSVQCQVGWTSKEASSSQAMAWLDELTHQQSEHLRHGLCTIVSLMFGVPIVVLLAIVWLNDVYRLVTQPVAVIGLISIVMVGVALPLITIATKLLHQLPVINHTS